MNERQSIKISSGTSLRPNPNGDRPQVDASAYVDRTAQIIGNVRVGPRVFVGPNSVIRADEVGSSSLVEPVEIGPECNVQDGVIIHALGGARVTVGRRSSLAHGCIVHGPCSLGEGCFVGFGAKIFDSEIGDRAFIGTGAVVQGVRLAPESFVPPGVSVFCREHVIKFVGTTGPENYEFAERVADANMKLAKEYIGLTVSDDL